MASFPVGDSRPLQLIRFNETNGDMEVRFESTRGNKMVVQRWQRPAGGWRALARLARRASRMLLLLLPLLLGVGGFR